MATVIAVVDSGPLYAAADEDDADHSAALNALTASNIHLVIPMLVVAEVSYFIGSRLGPPAEARFVAGLTALDVEAPTQDDWSRIAELVDEYGDFPLGGVDASVVALAERLDTPTVITLDRRHFGAVRPRHCQALMLIP
ncbi:MAG: PIN domain-containing protein [Candidatus Dormibacteraeota bacterium]|nr:PIN domain-containing protein [Candidatus Dormibacteraeota bacterium]MBV9526374.1 PIN domain-containing protein [Candidatus Dormibacteraeota bacterium]